MSIFTMYIYCLYIRLNVGIYSLHETCRIIPISPHVPAMLSKFTRLVPHQIAIFCFRKALFLMDVAPSWSWGLNLRQIGNSHLLLSRFPDQIEDFDVFLYRDLWIQERRGLMRARMEGMAGAEAFQQDGFCWIRHLVTQYWPWESIKVRLGMFSNTLLFELLFPFYFYQSYLGGNLSNLPDVFAEKGSSSCSWRFVPNVGLSGEFRLDSEELQPFPSRSRNRLDGELSLVEDSWRAKRSWASPKFSSHLCDQLNFLSIFVGSSVIGTRSWEHL